MATKKVSAGLDLATTTPVAPAKRKPAAVRATGARPRAGAAGTSRPSAAVASRPRATATPNTNALLAGEVAQEVELVRAALREAMTQFSHRIEAQLAALEAMLGAAAAGGRKAAPSPRVMAAMLAAIRNTRLKPGKGRLKDMARLEKLADKLEELAGSDG